MTATQTPQRERLLTIGAVCERLKSEFPDISISKIRYLEGEGLVTPQRTRGGYRLFGEDELGALETILRLQRDEFLPLKVIREELEKPTSPERRRRRAHGLRDTDEELDQAVALRARRHRSASRPRARGVRAAGSARRRRRALLQRDRCRDRCDLRQARRVRDRAAPSPNVPHVHRSRDRAARVRDCAGAALAQPGAPPGRHP
jgi:Predicted transcriptional regulators